MTTYAILCNPGHNRVYFDNAQPLGLGELTLALARFSVPCGQARWQELAGVRYLLFEGEGLLTERDLGLLSRLSFVYALFVLCPDGRLEPVPRAPYRFPEDLSAHLKYTGKTGELFTRFLLNAAALSYSGDPLSRLRVLDPVCGKGTTLQEALLAGYNGEGIDLNGKAVSEGVGYLKKYLELGFYKHTLHKERVSGPNKSFTAETASFTIGLDKASFKEDPYQVKFAVGDSRFCPMILGKNRFDLLVGDLPYGVQHQNVGAGGRGAGSRSPKELLTLCLPSWREALKKGGVLALSWNTFLLSRQEMLALLEKAGFAPFTEPPYDGFCHRVDAAISRDAVFGTAEK